MRFSWFSGSGKPPSGGCRHRVVATTLGVLTLTLGLLGVGSAQTLIPPPSATVRLANETIPRDAPVGTVIAPGPENIDYVQVANVNCTLTKVSTVSGNLVPGYSNVYQTTLPGVGVRFQYTSSWRGGYTTAPLTEIVTVPSGATGLQQFFRRAVYVIVGQVGTGVLTTPPSMTLTWSGNCVPTRSTTFSLQSGVTQVTPHTCSVTSNAVSVTLPPVAATDLASAGATAGATPFSIDLNCTPGSTVYLTLSDASDPGNRSNLLSLSPDSTARSVNVQVLHAGSLVSYGPDSPVAGNPNQILIGASSVTSQIPFSARYISAGSAQPGSVAATATFTMSYQ